MKKKIILGLCAALLAFVTSCMSITYPVDMEKYVTNIISWDENLPKEESVLIFLGNYWYTGESYPQGNYKITSYNGITVDWGPVMLRNTILYLPPGQTQLNLRTSLSYNNYRDIVEYNLQFEQNFSAGDRYSLILFFENGIPRIVLHDLIEKKPREEQITRYYLPPKTVIPGELGRTNPEGEATVVFGKGVYIMNLNGKYVYDDLYPDFTHNWRVNWQTIPAGNTTINFNIRHYDAKINLSVLISYINLEFTYFFEPGREYTLAIEERLVSPFVTEYSLNLYDLATVDGSAGPRGRIIKSWPLSRFHRYGNSAGNNFTNYSLETGELLTE
jgi:hypothetical protein